MDPPRASGTLCLASGKLAYRVPSGEAWELEVESLGAVGEYTLQEDPSSDDYFLVFVSTSGDFHRASFYADGRDSCLTDLGRELGATLRCNLRESTAPRSQVLWPKELIGAPLFAARGREGRSLLGRIRDLLGIRRYELELSRTVCKHVKTHREK